MKIKISISILLCMGLLLNLCACGANNAKTQDEYANQEKFLQDMANGITERLNHVNDNAGRTDEELYAYYETLVECELKKIEKYENQIFENPSFNDLAHAYIDACQMQQIMADNYKVQTLHGLWDSAKEIRESIITEMYTHYDLPITSEQAAQYATQNSGKPQYSASIDGELDLSTGLTMFDDKMITYDLIVIKDANGQILFDEQDIEITLKSLERENGQYMVNMTINNNQPSDKVTCYIGGSSIDEYQISTYSPYGYIFASPGMKCDTYSQWDEIDLKNIGKDSFETINAYLYVFTSDGMTGQYIAKIPLTIERNAFS